MAKNVVFASCALSRYSGRKLLSTIKIAMPDAHHICRDVSMKNLGVIVQDHVCQHPREHANDTSNDPTKQSEQTG